MRERTFETELTAGDSKGAEDDTDLRVTEPEARVEMTVCAVIDEEVDVGRAAAEDDDAISTNRSGAGVAAVEVDAVASTPSAERRVSESLAFAEFARESFDGVLASVAAAAEEEETARNSEATDKEGKDLGGVVVEVVAEEVVMYFVGVKSEEPIEAWE